MAAREFFVKCDWDAEAGVWFVSDSDVPGLSVEASSIDEMKKKVLEAAVELIALNMPELLRGSSSDADVPLSLVYQQQEHLKLRAV